MLSDWAAIAIVNARLYRAVRERRDELERTIRGLETTTEISRALGGVTDLGRVLELVVKRSRALLDARAARIVLLDGETAAMAGEEVSGEPTLTAPMTFRNRPLGLLSVVRRPVQRRGRAPAAGLRGQRRDRGGDGAERRRGGAAAQPRGLRGRARPLGARAARRDAAAARRAAHAAGRSAPQRRPGAHRRGARGGAGAAHDRDRRPAQPDRRPAARRARRARAPAGAGVARGPLGESTSICGSTSWSDWPRTSSRPSTGSSKKP